MLTINELRQLPTKDLHEELQRVSREYLKIKMDVEGGFAKESHKAKQLRRQIARIQTIQKEIQIEKATKPKKEEEPKKPAAKKTEKKVAKKTTKQEKKK